MLDKLCLNSPEVIDFETACQQLRGRFNNIKKTLSGYHENVYSFRRGLGREEEQILALHCGPRFANVANTKLEVNPARFASFYELNEFLELLVSPNDCAVTRLDQTVDIPVPIALVWESLIWPRKQTRDRWKGQGLTGFYFGERPEKLLVYDRAKHLGTLGTLTRIELKSSGPKVPTKKYLELSGIVNRRPFQNARWLNLSAAEDRSHPRRKNNLEELKKAVEYGGAQAAFKKFNLQSNFSRDFADCFSRPQGIPDLDDLFQANMRRYFGNSNECQQHPA